MAEFKGRLFISGSEDAYLDVDEQDNLVFKDKNTSIKILKDLTKIVVGTIPPSNPSVGDLWIDTN